MIRLLIFCIKAYITVLDIKPENCLLSEASPAAVLKLGDFGLCRAVPRHSASSSDSSQPSAAANTSHTRVRYAHVDVADAAKRIRIDAAVSAQPLARPTVAGTSEFLAPEIILLGGDESSTGESIGQPMDVWSLGVVLYFALAARTPFHHRDEAATYRRILTADYEPLPVLKSTSVTNTAKTSTGTTPVAASSKAYPTNARQPSQRAVVGTTPRRPTPTFQTKVWSGGERRTPPTHQAQSSTTPSGTVTPPPSMIMPQHTPLKPAAKDSDQGRRPSLASPAPIKGNGVTRLANSHATWSGSKGSSGTPTQGSSTPGSAHDPSADPVSTMPPIGRKVETFTFSPTEMETLEARHYASPGKSFQSRRRGSANSRTPERVNLSRPPQSPQPAGVLTRRRSDASEDGAGGLPTPSRSGIRASIRQSSHRRLHNRISSAGSTRNLSPGCHRTPASITPSRDPATSDESINTAGAARPGSGRRGPIITSRRGSAAINSSSSGGAGARATGVAGIASPVAQRLRRGSGSSSPAAHGGEATARGSRGRRVPLRQLSDSGSFRRLSHEDAHPAGSVNPPPAISADAWDLLRSLLTVDVSARPSITDVLRHTWLRADPTVAEYLARHSLYSSSAAASVSAPPTVDDNGGSPTSSPERTQYLRSSSSRSLLHIRSPVHTGASSRATAPEQPSPPMPELQLTPHSSSSTSTAVAVSQHAASLQAMRSAPDGPFRPARHRSGDAGKGSRSPRAAIDPGSDGLISPTADTAQQDFGDALISRLRLELSRSMSSSPENSPEGPHTEHMPSINDRPRMSEGGQAVYGIFLGSPSQPASGSISNQTSPRRLTPHAPAGGRGAGAVSPRSQNQSPGIALSGMRRMVHRHHTLVGSPDSPASPRDSPVHIYEPRGVSSGYGSQDVDSPAPQPMRPFAGVMGSPIQPRPTQVSHRTRSSSRDREGSGGISSSRHRFTSRRSSRRGSGNSEITEINASKGEHGTHRFERHHDEGQRQASRRMSRDLSPGSHSGVSNASSGINYRRGGRDREMGLTGDRDAGVQLSRAGREAVGGGLSMSAMSILPSIGRAGVGMGVGPGQ